MTSGRVRRRRIRHRRCRAPSPLDTIIQQSRAAINEHDLGDARERINQGLALAPENLTLLDLGGFVLLLSRRLCRYRVVLPSCARGQSDHAYACKGLGLALARQGRVDEGVQSLERAIALAPEWVDSYWDLAVTLLEAGRTDEALQVVERGETAVPAEAKRLHGLAQTIRTRVRH